MIGRYLGVADLAEPTATPRIVFVFVLRAVLGTNGAAWRVRCDGAVSSADPAGEVDLDFVAAHLACSFLKGT